MRVNVNPVWLAKKDHRDLDACEKALGRLIANRRIIMSCAYPLAIRHTQEIPEAGYSHRFAIARQQGDWKIVETPELSETRAIVKRLTAELERCDTERRFAAEALCGAQEALRASGERSLCYFELGLVGMATVSPAEGCLEVNDRLCAMLGYQRSELMRMTWSDLAHPDDLTADLQTYDRILTGKADGVQLAKRWIHKNGDVIQTNVSLKCQRRKDGSVDYFAVMVQEVAGADPTVEGPVLPGPQNLVHSRIGGGAVHRLGPDCERDRRHARAQREDGQHLSQPHSDQTAAQDHIRADSLRNQKPPLRVVFPTSDPPLSDTPRRQPRKGLHAGSFSAIRILADFAVASVPEPAEQALHNRGFVTSTAPHGFT
jgi:PAS domain S-box-containing protein